MDIKLEPFSNSKFFKIDEDCGFNSDDLVIYEYDAANAWKTLVYRIYDKTFHLLEFNEDGIVVKNLGSSFDEVMAKFHFKCRHTGVNLIQFCYGCLFYDALKEWDELRRNNV